MNTEDLFTALADVKKQMQHTDMYDPRMIDLMNALVQIQDSIINNRLL